MTTSLFLRKEMLRSGASIKISLKSGRKKVNIKPIAPYFSSDVSIIIFCKCFTVRCFAKEKVVIFFISKTTFVAKG